MIYQVAIEDVLNSLIKDLCNYSIEYGCSIDDAVNDYDQPLSFLGSDLDVVTFICNDILNSLKTDTIP